MVAPMSAAVAEGEEGHGAAIMKVLDEGELGDTGFLEDGADMLDL